MSKPSISKIVKERVRENPQSLTGAIAAGVIGASMPLIHKFLNSWGRRQVLKFLNWIASFSTGGALIMENYGAAIITGILALLGFILEIAASRVAEMARGTADDTGTETSNTGGTSSVTALLLFLGIAGLSLFSVGCDDDDTRRPQPAVHLHDSSALGHTAAEAPAGGTWSGPSLAVFLGSILYIGIGCAFIFSQRNRGDRITIGDCTKILLWPAIALLYILAALLLRIDDWIWMRKIKKAGGMRRRDYFGNFAVLLLAALCALTLTSCKTGKAITGAVTDRAKNLGLGIYGTLSGKELCVCVGKTDKAAETTPEENEITADDIVIIRDALEDGHPLGGSK
jgi:hypothetical protein